MVFDSAPSRTVFDSFTSISVGDILGVLDGAVVGLRSGVRFGWCGCWVRVRCMVRVRVEGRARVRVRFYGE